MAANLLKLVRSLSKSEKRDFRLHVKKMKGANAYADLFDLAIGYNPADALGLKTAFAQIHPTASFEASVQYLMRVLTDGLVQSGKQKNARYRLLFGLMRLQVLKDRNLDELWLKELRKLTALSGDIQNYPITSLLLREELNHLSDSGFPGMNEQQLIEKQIQIRELQKTIRNTHEHYTLFEVLKHRLLHYGKTVSEANVNKLNDLLLSELSIMNNRIRHNSESRKIHLLFQSFFFTQVGDYRSALKSFSDLNMLFEKNTSLWEHDPADYLSALDGILDSLRTLGLFNEMEFFLSRLALLAQKGYPDHFCSQVQENIIIYQTVYLLGTQQWEKALVYIEEHKVSILKQHHIINDAKHSELLFYAALVYFKSGKRRKAQQYINEILLLKKPDHANMIFRTARLLSLILYFEDDDLEYIDYSIRSYKRLFTGKSKLLNTEKLLFRILQQQNSTPTSKQALERSGVYKTILQIRQDKFERQLLKFYDFTEWIETWCRIKDKTRLSPAVS